MKIGIDGRLWLETGVGRYIRALVDGLADIDKHNNYVLFLRPETYRLFTPPGSRWQKVEADVRWHTFSEQLLMPYIYSRYRLDLVHIPYFSVPILTPLSLVVTIHDLTLTHMATGKATTLSLPLYQLKRLGYQLTIHGALRKARRIVTVSSTVKKDLVTTYHIEPERVAVIYEAGDLETGRDKNDSRPLTNPYFLYVGNAHPHKNLPTLLAAFKIFVRKYPNMALVCIGRKDFFYERLRGQVLVQKLTDQVVFAGEVSNAELSRWYKHAVGLIFPSLSEGFGIPGLEAMTQGCPVIASDISVFREVYGPAAIYFKPYQETALVKAMFKIINDNHLRKSLIRLGYKQAQKYSWKKMAQETLKLYESSVGI